MGKFVDKAVEVGTLGIVKDASGTKQARKDAFNASQAQLRELQAGTAMARNDLTNAFDPAMKDLNTGFTSGMREIRHGLTNSEAPLQSFYQQGQQASEMEAALSGALGAQAQADAFAAYQESPEIAYMREMGEKSALRGAASQGMSLSGSVLEELNRRGTGLAMQGFGQTMARLNSIANRGQNSANNIANLRNSSASNLANMRTGLGQALAGTRLQQGQNLANISTGNAAQRAEIQGQLGVANANAGLAQNQMAFNLAGAGLGAMLGGV